MKNYVWLILFVCSGVQLKAQIWPFEKTDREVIHDGNISYAKGDFTDALKQYERIMLSSPDNPYAAYNIGSAAYKAKNYDEAVRYYKNGLNKMKTDQQKSDLYYNLGNAYFQKKDYEQSIKAYKDALKLDPQNEEARYNLSYVLQELRKQNPPPPQNQQKQNQEQQMNENEAENMLNDLDDEEKDIRQQMNNKARRDDNEKDW